MSPFLIVMVNLQLGWGKFIIRVPQTSIKTKRRLQTVISLFYNSNSYQNIAKPYKNIITPLTVFLFF